MTPPPDVDVAVVGYGPVGALTALLLARAGLAVAVLERRERLHPLPRAVAADDEVLRLLEAAGLADAVAAMVPVPGATFLGATGRVLLEVDFPGTGRLPGLALFRQPDLERDLRRLVAVAGVRVLAGREVRDLRQDREGVVLAHAAPGDPPGHGAELRASYVVGCDGARSTVRGLLGVPTTGPRAAQRWLVADLRTDDPVPTPARVVYRCDPRLTTVQMPVPGGRRVEVLLPGAAPAPGPDAVPALLAPLLDGAAGDPVSSTLERAADYTYGVRRARRWRVGRVLLAGDAAHTMPPFAGQGLAAGLRDAVDLGWRLPLVVGGTAGPGLLDGYERERRPHVARMTALSRVAGAVLTTPTPARARARDTALTALVRAPRARRWLRAGGPRPRQALRIARGLGARPRGLLPDARVAAPGAAPVPLDTLLAGHFTLVGLGVDPREGLGASARALWQRLAGASLRVDQPASSRAPGLLDVDGALGTLGAGRVAVLRPDRQVVAVVPLARVDAAVTALAAGLGGGAGTTRTTRSTSTST